MATKLYLEASGAVPAIKPAPNAGWTVIDQYTALPCGTVKADTAMSTKNITTALETVQDIIIGQFFSKLLTPGQTITGAQTVSIQVRASETDTGNNLFLTWGVYVFNGITLKKTVITKKADGTEVIASLKNRTDSTTSVAGNYTTVYGDRLVIEVGLSGDPGSGKTHSGSLSFGSDSASDLPADDATTDPFNPNVILADTLTFTTMTTTSSTTSSTMSTVSSSSSSTTTATAEPLVYCPYYDVQEAEEYSSDRPAIETRFGKGYSERRTLGYRVRRWKGRYVLLDSFITRGVWKAKTGYEVGDYVSPVAGGNYVHMCVADGVSGSSEPSWVATEEASIVDGSVTWQCVINNQLTALLNFVEGREGRVEAFYAYFPILSTWIKSVFLPEPLTFTTVKAGIYSAVVVDVAFEEVP